MKKNKTAYIIRMPHHSHKNGRKRCVLCALLAYQKMVEQSWSDAIAKALWAEEE